MKNTNILPETIAMSSVFVLALVPALVGILPAEAAPTMERAVAATPVEKSHGPPEPVSVPKTKELPEVERPIITASPAPEPEPEPEPTIEATPAASEVQQVEDEPMTRQSQETPSQTAPQTLESTPKVEPATTTEKSPPAPTGGVVGTAMAYQGTPYVWGGNSPSGWDCSGMIQWVYAQHGISVPRGTSALLNSSMFTRVSSPQPGDLIFQSGGGHAGIYIGDGQMISARNPSAGTTVHGTDWNGGISAILRVK